MFKLNDWLIICVKQTALVFRNRMLISAFFKLNFLLNAYILIYMCTSKVHASSVLQKYCITNGFVNLPVCCFYTTSKLVYFTLTWLFLWWNVGIRSLSYCKCLCPEINKCLVSTAFDINTFFMLIHWRLPAVSSEIIFVTRTFYALPHITTINFRLHFWEF